ncbi:alpha amylase, catalytic region [Maricaulis maris MCS10]|uniref:Alpha amylase, catalytic region n=1 Tax=Maricaulis maris (strain MCS10) TaxID=394221 RepID=Q0AL18_MARMM|nr:alpha-amylase family glycosyl hydrolase [Maricaulis maris]ABI67025.1 alpha amylase, catalytic region [Maricaulis maris MCS10]
MSSQISKLTTGLLAATCLTACAAGQPENAPTPIEISDRSAADEIIYFVMPDRFENGDTSNDQGGLDGDRLQHGYDPTARGFYHGGDLAGLTQQLDYIQGLGATAIWLTPIFQNQAVQGGPGQESSAYHGYWITDFTRPDAHLGSRDEFRTFVQAAHARGMRVYMDIITNHTADVFAYRECHDPDSPLYIDPQGQCPYRRIGDYPWTTQGGPDGAPINEGFVGDDPVNQTAANYARLTDPNWAYTPYLPDGAPVRTPDWLNDATLYHNRGESFWFGESELYGDFSGLDDLNTEHPRVLDGMIDIYKDWITEFRVDGFRIDTAKHVQPEFWVRFSDEIMDHARSEGIEHFHMFGEVYEFDAGQLARYISEAGLPAYLDFAFQGTARGFVVDGEPGDTFQDLFRIDAVLEGGFATASTLPTFLGNHDMGRMAGFLRETHPDMSDAEMFARLRLANALMFFSRGTPTIYYGDEQGFVSDGGDQLAREDMFASTTDEYNDNNLVGTDASTADRNFDREHPLYQAIASMAELRQTHRTLRRGEQIVRHADNEDSLLVMSRVDYETGEEYVIAYNGETAAQTIRVEVDGRAGVWESLAGVCPMAGNASGTLALDIPALDYVVCRTGFAD